MLLSRVADTLYWMSRYLERAEHTTRLLDVRLDLGLDRRPDADRWDFSRLYAALRPPYTADAPASPAALVDALVFDLSNRDSVLACVTAARENARQVREEISSDMWEQAAIERDNPSLKGVLPKDFGRPNLDKIALGRLINLVSDIALGRRPIGPGTRSAASTNTFCRNSPVPRARRAGSSTRRPASCGCSSRCSRPTRDGSTTRAVARAGCS